MRTHFRRIPRIEYFASIESQYLTLGKRIIPVDLSKLSPRVAIEQDKLFVAGQ